MEGKCPWWIRRSIIRSNVKKARERKAAEVRFIPVNLLDVTPYEAAQPHHVTFRGRVMFHGTVPACFEFLLRQQRDCVRRATENGWIIERIVRTTTA